MPRPLGAGAPPLELVPPAPTPPPDAASLLCPPARELAEYAAKLIDPMEDAAHPRTEQIARAVFLIQVKYFRLLEKAPKAHRGILHRRGHVCLGTVFHRSHERLMALWEGEMEVRISEPPKPAPPPAVAPKPRTVYEALAEAFGS